MLHSLKGDGNSFLVKIIYIYSHLVVLGWLILVLVVPIYYLLSSWGRRLSTSLTAPNTVVCYPILSHVGHPGMSLGSFSNL